MAENTGRQFHTHAAAKRANPAALARAVGVQAHSKNQRRDIEFPFAQWLLTGVQ